jgi:esterase/lipase superfamily enzyme
MSIVRSAVRGAFFSLAFITAGAGVASAECSPAPAKDAVYFVTDREPVTDDQFFTGERGIMPSRDAIVTRGIMTESPEGTFFEERCSSEKAFLAALGQSLSANRQIMYYIHGYYTTFRQAVSDALQVRKGLGFKGPTILYSWPSKVTSRLAYIKDEANAYWSIPRFRRLVATVEERYKKVPVTMISHSLGSRFAADAIETLRRGPCPDCLKKAIFFAPDIDADTLHSDLAETGLCHGRPPTEPSSSAPVTVYVSNRDVALRQSQKLHGFERAGQAGSEMVLCGGADTIDVSYYKSVDKAGHSYQVDPRILEDAKLVLAGVSPRDARRKLGLADRERGQYYELR